MSADASHFIMQHQVHVKWQGFIHHLLTLSWVSAKLFHEHFSVVLGHKIRRLIYVVGMPRLYQLQISMLVKKHRLNLLLGIMWFSWLRADAIFALENAYVFVTSRLSWWSTLVCSSSLGNSRVGFPRKKAWWSIVKLRWSRAIYSLKKHLIWLCSLSTSCWSK